MTADGKSESTITREEAEAFVREVFGEDDETSVPDLATCDGCGEEFPEGDLEDGLCIEYCLDEAREQDRRQAETIKDYKSGLL